MNEAPWENSITLGEILDLHRKGIERHGGMSGLIKGVECVQGSLGNAWTNALYSKSLNPFGRSIIFAAHLLKNLVAAHCFLDGNKRVAWTAMATILARNGLTISATTDESQEFMIEVIESHVEPTAILDWLSQRIIETAQG